jgi:hypothetical protein
MQDKGAEVLSMKQMVDAYVSLMFVALWGLVLVLLVG